MASCQKNKVKVLSDVQIKRTFSGSVKDASGKAKKKVVRAAMKNPHPYIWPTLSEDVEGSIMRELIKFFESRARPRPSADLLSERSEIRRKFLDEIRRIIRTRPRLSKDKKKARVEAARSAMRAALADKPTTSIRSDVPRRFVVGVNLVMKNGERGRLLAAVVDADKPVQLLTNALLPLCSVKNVPAVALRGMNNALSPILGVKTITAVGIVRPDADDDDDDARPLVELIARHGTINL